MIVIPWPDDLAPWRVMFYLQPHVGGAESPLTRTRKTYGLSRPRWVARLTFRAGYDGADDQDAAGFGPRLDALIADLEGGLNLAGVWDWRRPHPIRDQFLSGAMVTAAPAAIGATSVPVAGFSPYSIAFSIGDYIGLGDDRPHLVNALATAGADGVASVSFKPPLAATLASGSAIVTENVPGKFQLMSEDAGQNETEVGQLTPYVLDFVEYLP
jgi:hypothetical protein